MNEKTDGSARGQEGNTQQLTQQVPTGLGLHLHIYIGTTYWQSVNEVHIHIDLLISFCYVD